MQMIHIKKHTQFCVSGVFGLFFGLSLALLFLILYDFHSLLPITHVFFHVVSILLVRAVSILNPVVLNSHSDNSNIFAMSGFDALSLQVIFLPLDITGNFPLIAGYVVLGKETAVSRSLAMWQ